LVYGATGYTARLVIEALLRADIRPVLSARKLAPLKTLAEKLGLPYVAAQLDEPGSLSAALQGMRVVLNVAGPFVQTAAAVARACLVAGAHYLDISGEVDALSSLSKLHTVARERGVMLMPGVGFDIVPSDCLCAYTASKVPSVRRLRVAVSGLELASPGSLKTLVYELGRRTRVRRGGELVDIMPGELRRQFDFGAGPKPCVAVSWGDLITAPVTTGATDVETYFELTWALAATLQANRQFGWFYRLPWVQQALRGSLSIGGGGPTAEQMATRRAAIVVEAEGPGGRASNRLVTPEAYTLTAATAAAIAVRVLSGDVEVGFQTPGRIFGPDFILRFAGVTRVEVGGSGF
jgi:short subunit dehydrogenase-like uncharacterized protein